MKPCFLAFLAVLYASILTGCGTASKSGKYYDNDGPPSAFSAIGMSRTDAVPKVEKPIAATNRPYKVMGKTYTPVTGDKPMTQTGYASWYGKQFHGKKTSTGEIYDMYEMTAAHTTMELPSYAKVTNLENGKSVIVRVNDRGPFLHSRVIDLSYAAATKLGYVKKGTAKVRVERITRTQIAAGKIPSTSQSLLASVSAPSIVEAVAKNNAAKGTAAKSVVAKNADAFAGKPAEPDFITAVALASNSSDAGFSDLKTSVIDGIREEVTPLMGESAAASVMKINAASDRQSEIGPTPTTMREFEQEAREEVISALKQQAANTTFGASAQKYVVQLGVFRSDANARALKQRFSRELGDKIGEEVRIVTVDGLNKVIVGRKMSEEQAKVAVSLVREALGIKALVLKE